MNGDGLEDCGAMKPAECQGRIAERLESIEGIAREARDEAREGRRETREALEKMGEWRSSVDARCADHRVEIERRLAEKPAVAEAPAGPKPWPRPITLSLGAGGAAALGAAAVKIIELLTKHA